MKSINKQNQNLKVFCRLKLENLKNIDYYILVIILIFTLLTLINLDHRGIWYDEAFSIVLARKSFEELIETTIQDTHPPLYYFNLKIWVSVFGESEFSVRFLSYVFALFVVILTYYLAKRLFSGNIAILSSAFIAMNPFFIQYVREARMYSLFSLLVMVCMFLFFDLTENPSIKKGIVYSISLACMLYTHNYALFAIAIQIILTCYLFVFEKDINRKYILFVFIFQLLALVFYFPWLFVFLNQMNSVSGIGGAIQNPNSGHVMNTLKLFCFQEEIIFRLILIAIAFKIAMVRVNFHFKRNGKLTFPRTEFDIKTNRNFIFSIFFFLFFIGVPFFISWKNLIGYSVYAHRYTLSALPFLSMCTFYSISSLYNIISNHSSFSVDEFLMIKKNIIPGLFFVTVMIFSLITLSHFSVLYSDDGYGYREAVELIQKNYYKNDTILLEAYFTVIAFDYYSRNALNHSFHPIGFDGNETINVVDYYLQNSHGLWYIMAHSRDYDRIVISWAKENGYLIFTDNSRPAEIYYFTMQDNVTIETYHIS